MRDEMEEDAMTNQLLQEMHGAVLVLTMNRPEARNALTGEMTAALVEALEAAAGDAAVRAVVLTGAGGAFCAGGDVKAFSRGAGMDASREERTAGLRGRMEASRLLHQMPKPTIAAIPGAAAGAGLSLALACDFRICATTAKLTTAFAKVGLSGDFGGTWLMTQILGTAKARELYLLSPVLMGEEAQAIGLVTKVVEPEQVAGAALELAGQLAEGPTATLGRMKANLNAAAAGQGIEEVMDLEAENHTISMETADHREAAKAFVEKRKPVFSGA